MSTAFDNVPVNRFLDFRMVERSAQRVVLEQDVRDHMLQETGVVQGGLLTALADTAAVYLLWPDLGPNRTMTGSTVSISFLSAALPNQGVLRCEAQPLRVGRKLAVCESCVYQGDKLVAKGTFTFVLMDR